MAVTLKDAKGGIVACLSDETFDVRDLRPGPVNQAPVLNHTSEWWIGRIAPTTRPGTYDLYVSVGSRDGTPAIALPLSGDDGQKRYKLGQMTLRGVEPGKSPPP